MWKVSYPDFPILQSFIHSEVITVTLIDTLTKITIFERPRTEQHLHMKTIFYNEIEAMNKNLSDYIVKKSQREGEVTIDQEVRNELVSNSDLDFNEIGPERN
jgi:glutamate 5-kinase